MVDEANARIKQLVTICSSSANSSQRKTITRRQSQLEKSVTSIRDAVTPLTTSSDACLIRQYEERLQVHKTDLRELSTSLLAMNLEDSDDLCTSQNGLEKLIFECDLIVKKLLVTEQFDVANHPLKLAYLRNSLKDGLAKGIIATSGKYYEEAIATLGHHTIGRGLFISPMFARLLRPLVLRKGLVVRFVDFMIPYNNICEPSGPFITSILELKLDASTSFEWKSSARISLTFRIMGNCLTS